jgi:hypothetical protein
MCVRLGETADSCRWAARIIAGEVGFNLTRMNRIAISHAAKTMDFQTEIVDRLGSVPKWGYHANAPAASEPTALAALALLHFGHPAAGRALDWLANLQSTTGAVGVMEDQNSPNWPTSLAVLAWAAAERHDATQIGLSDEAYERRALTPALSPREREKNGAPALFQWESERYIERIETGVAWMLSVEGKTIPRQANMGHDTTLVGWPWVAGTHSWLEPTAFCTLALRAAGESHHLRTIEAIRLIRDRMLAAGGWNYGNTAVLGQQLLPHIQPTGIALLALAGQPRDERLDRSIAYLTSNIGATTATASLCFALIGLAAHDVEVDSSDKWLAAAYHRTIAKGGSPHALALLALAALDRECPLITLPGGDRAWKPATITAAAH